MSKDIDWLVEDKRARKAYEEEHGKHISYGNFRQFHPELVPSKHKKNPQVVKNARNYCSPHYNRHRQLTEEDDEVIAEKYKDGMSIEQIAREMQVSAPTVRTHLQNMGLSLRAAPKKDWTEKEIETLKTLYFRNESIGYIAEMLNRSLNSVRAKIASTGLQKLKIKMKNRCEAATSSAASKNSLN